MRVFHAAQMSDKAGDSWPAVQTCVDSEGNPVYYFLPNEYKHLDATVDDLTKKFTGVFKFSTWLRTKGTDNKQGMRMQVWTLQNDQSKIRADMTDVKTFDGTIARPIRAVIY